MKKPPHVLSSPASTEPGGIGRNHCKVGHRGATPTHSERSARHSRAVPFRRPVSASKIHSTLKTTGPLCCRCRVYPDCREGCLPQTSHENPVRAANLGQMRLAESSIRRLASSLPFDGAGFAHDGRWRVGHGGSAAKHKIAYQQRDKCSRLRVLNHSRPMVIPPINAGGRPAWLWGAAVVGASNSKPATLMNRPLEAISTKLVPKKKKFRLPSANTPPDVPIPCGSQEAQRWDKLLTATTMSSTADYRTIYCVPIVSAGTGIGTGTLGAFGCLSQTPFHTRLGTA